MANAVTYKDLYLSFGEVISIDYLEITQKPNHHGHLTLSAVLDGEKEGEVFDAVPETIAVLYMEEGVEKILFKGIVADSGMKRLGNHRKLDLEAYDATYLFDTVRKTRSFQNTSRTNHSVIAEVMQEYPDCICMKNLPEEAIGRIWFQYEETDWEFLCRFLSSYSDSLYADATYHTARFQAGLSPEDIDTDWDRAPYRMSKNLERYDYLSQNGFDGLMPQQFVEYSVDSYDLYTLGSRLIYKGREWYIGALTRSLQEGLLVNTYELKQKEGMLVPQYYNRRITGISVDGSTAEIQRDKVRVTINGDMTTEQGTYWFPFSTVAASADGSGWYSMPEKGDTIRVYFPTCDEKEGYVITKHGSHTPAPKSTGRSISGGGSGYAAYGEKSGGGEGEYAACGMMAGEDEGYMPFKAVAKYGGQGMAAGGLVMLDAMPHGELRCQESVDAVGIEGVGVEEVGVEEVGIEAVGIGEVGIEEIGIDAVGRMGRMGGDIRTETVEMGAVRMVGGERGKALREKFGQELGAVRFSAVEGLESPDRSIERIGLSGSGDIPKIGEKNGKYIGGTDRGNKGGFMNIDAERPKAWEAQEITDDMMQKAKEMHSNEIEDVGIELTPPMDYSGMQSVEIMGDYEEGNPDYWGGGFGIGDSGSGSHNDGGYSSGSNSGGSGGSGGYSSGGASGGGSNSGGGYGTASAADALTGAEESENPMDDPSKRNIFTKDGCLVQMTEAGVILTAGKASITLNKSGNMILTAPRGISLYAGRNMSVNGNKITLLAGDMLETKNIAGAKVKMKMLQTKFSAKEIYEN